MGELGEYWRDVKPTLKEKRKKHVKKMGDSAKKNIESLGYPYKYYENTKQFAIETENETIDYWGTTGTWIARKTKKRGKGLKTLRIFINKKNEKTKEEENQSNPNVLTEKQFELMQQTHDLFSNKILVEQYCMLSGRNMKDLTDPHHSMRELYEHRRKLFNIIIQAFPEHAWKAKKHHNGEVWGGLFIVGFDIPNIGQYTYHYHLEFWDEFQIKELAFAPEYDGHTPKDIDRLFHLLDKKIGEKKWK